MACDHRALFFTARVLSTVALFSVAIGQQVGVSLQLQGKTISNNSLVNLADLLYRTSHLKDDPTNSNGLQTLMCVTDFVDCCETPARGYWYYPNGSRVEFNEGHYATFLSNRGQNEIVNDQKFYGSVRIWHRYTPLERGLFRCELPDANGINQNCYVNILLFSRIANSNLSVAISTSGSNTAGEMYSLNCSATLYPNRNPPLSDPIYNIISPTFEWFFGPNGNAPLPSGLTAMATDFNGNTYTSKLEFSPLNQSHTGNYTCRLGAGNLVNGIMFTVTAPSISATITANLTAFLKVGQIGNTLTCEVSGAERLNPTIAYHWTRNNQAVSDGNLKTLSLSPLRLSDAGNYTCHVTVSSALLNNSISALASSDKNQIVVIQTPDPRSITLTSSGVLDGADVTINCIVEFGQALMESELSLLKVDVQLSRKGTDIMRNLSDSNPTISGTTLTYSTVVNSFHRSDSGNYSCVATIRPHPNLAQPFLFYLRGTGKSVSNQTQVTTGVFFFSRGSYVNTNSSILITDIGEGDCGALLCYTDHNGCCHGGNTTVGDGALGQWFYPNRSVVGTRSDGQDFYVDRGSSVIRLNRRSNTTSTTGWFCCVVPDVTSTNIRICINVVAQQSKQIVTCTTEVAIGAAVAVGATIITECLIIGAPIIVVLLLCQKRRLAVREFSEKDNHYELSNKAATVRGCKVKEIVSTEPDHKKMAIAKSVTQGGDLGEDTYEVMNNNYTMLLRDGPGIEDDNIYVVPDNNNIATTMRGSGVREDTYDVPYNTVNTAAATIAMWPRGGEREGAVHEDPDNPGATTSLRVKFELY